MRKIWYLPVVVGATLLTTFVAGPAYAATAVLTSGSTAGPATTGTVSAPVVNPPGATFFEPGTTTGVTCTSSTLSGTITSNPAPPGTATLGNSDLTFGNCTENIAGAIGVSSLATTNGPYTASVSSGGAVTVNGPINALVKLITVLGTISCTYSKASVNGTASNADNSITFTNQRFTKVTGSSICFSSIDFSAKYRPVTDSGGAAVFVN